MEEFVGENSNSQEMNRKFVVVVVIKSIISTELE